jgi:energy-coupling factor transporter transmembrane protein EcfT
MIVARDLAPAQLDSLLGRASPVLKIAIAIGWFVGLATTREPGPPAVIAVVAIAAGVLLGRIPLGDLGNAVAPVWLAAIGLATFNTLFAAANSDPSAVLVATLGPFPISQQGLAAGVGLGLRLIAIGAAGAVFVLTTDSTRLVDSLVQQARVPERFAYGALAAYQAVPRFGEDLTTLRQARRIRGLRGGWHPRLLVGLLVLAIRHGDRIALAMDARAFGSGSRSSYRLVRWSRVDLDVAVGSVAALVAALALAAAGQAQP